MSARTLVLRDGGRVVRDPIDVLRAAFFAGALVFAIRGELGGVANLLVAGGALLVARAVNLPRLDDLGFTIAMILGSNLQLSNRDTVGDLIADTLGSAAGARCWWPGPSSAAARCAGYRDRAGVKTRVPRLEHPLLRL
jgi:hypothetical protein